LVFGDFEAEVDSLAHGAGFLVYIEHVSVTLRGVNLERTCQCNWQIDRHFPLWILVGSLLLKLVRFHLVPC